MSEEVEGTGLYIEPVDYWRWRLTIEEQSHAKSKLESAQKNVKIKELERHIELYRFQDANRVNDAAKEEYVKITKEIEEKIGLPLKDVIIDEHTFEVKQIIKLEQGE